jgi:hypothetical protein
MQADVHIKKGGRMQADVHIKKGGSTLYKQPSQALNEPWYLRIAFGLQTSYYTSCKRIVYNPTLNKKIPY